MAETNIIGAKETNRYFPYQSSFRVTRKSFWTAGQDSFTQPPAQNPDMFQSLINVEPVTQGNLQRRRGYTLLSNQNPSTPFNKSYAFRSEALNLRRLVWTSAGNIVATDEAGANLGAGGTAFQVFTPSLNANAIRMVLSRSYGYFADGFSGDYKKWDGTTVPGATTNWGINLNATSVGPNFAGTAVDQGNSGGNGNQGPLNSGTGTASGAGKTWFSPQNIASSGLSTSCPSIPNTNGVSQTLSATNFGFSIPSAATVVGISANVTRKTNNAFSGKDNGIFLVGGGGSTTDHSSSSLWPTTAGIATYGGSTDLWGTTWTPTQINAAGFGFTLSVQAALGGSGSFTATVFAFITVTVYFTTPPNPSWTNPGNITGACDGLVTTATASASATSDLRATNYAFTGISGTITGIQVLIKASTSNASIPISLNPILIKTGTPTGTRKNSFVTSTSLQSITYGGQFDLWGASFAPSDINSVTTFGVQFNANTVSGSATISVDCVSITVFTTAGAITLGTPTAGSITLLSGRTYTYAFQNSKSPTVSYFAPFSASTGALTAQQQPLNSIPTPSDTQADTVLILATLDGNDTTTLYLLASVLAGTGTYTDNTPDSVLLTQPIYQQTDIGGNLHGIANNYPPPLINNPTKHKGRLFGLIGQTLYYSKNLDDVTTSTGTITSKWEEAWPLTYQQDISELAETGTALFSDGETLWIGTDHNIRRMIGDSPSNFQKPEIEFSEAGVINQEVWKVCYKQDQPVGTAWLTPALKVMFSDFNTYQDIGRPIQDVLNSVNRSVAQTVSHACFVSKGQSDYYKLYIPTGSSTVPNTLCVYNVNTGKWSIWQPTDNITTSLFNYDVNGNPQWLFATQLGPVYFWDSTTNVDRNGNTPVSFQVSLTTSWLDFGDEGLTKSLNKLVIVNNTAPSNFTVSLFGAISDADLDTGGTQLLPPTNLQVGFFNESFVPFVAIPTFHRWFQFVFTTPTGNDIDILDAFDLEVQPGMRI